jgi:hypothetical protein
MEENINAHMVLVGKPEAKRDDQKNLYSWENNIKMNLRVRGCGGVDWIHLAQDRDQWKALVNIIMDLRVP